MLKEFWKVALVVLYESRGKKERVILEISTANFGIIPEKSTTDSYETRPKYSQMNISKRFSGATEN